jgi:hypothetical protein
MVQVESKKALQINNFELAFRGVTAFKKICAYRN